MALTLTGNVLSKISFCDKQCSNVNDNKFKAQTIQNIDSKYKIQIVTRDYNILNPNILRNVSYHQHILTTYTNGNPYMLYLTKISTQISQRNEYLIRKLAVLDMKPSIKKKLQF
jgi:hypothetical protein